MNYKLCTNPLHMKACAHTLYSSLVRESGWRRERGEPWWHVWPHGKIKWTNMTKHCGCAINYSRITSFPSVFFFPIMTHVQSQSVLLTWLFLNPFQSRLVRNEKTHFYWTTRRDDIDCRSLRHDQMTNHYANAGTFTTKVSSLKTSKNASRLTLHIYVNSCIFVLFRWGSVWICVTFGGLIQPILTPSSQDATGLGRMMKNKHS